MEARAKPGDVSIARTIFSPVFDYFGGWKKFAIVSAKKQEASFYRDLGSHFLTKFLLGSIMVSTFVNFITTNDGALDIVPVPFLNDALFLAVFAIGGIVMAMLSLPLIRAFGGRENFKNTATTYIFVGGLLMPLLTLADGVIFLTTGDLPAPQAAGAASAYIYASALKSLHGISLGKAFVAILVPSCILGFLLGFLFSMLLL